MAVAAGAPAAVGLVALSEAAVPLPVPGDALMLFVGERAAAGVVPLWLAVLGLEVATVLGVGLLFYAVRGPAASLISRIGPRVGLTPDRLDRTSAIVNRGGGRMLAVGRAAPGFRTLTVVVAASSPKVSPGRALLALAVGGSLFVQLHLVLGYLFGPLMLDVIHRALPIALAVGLALLGGAVVWYGLRRGRGGATGAVSEGMCPACLALGYLAERQLRAEG